MADSTRMTVRVRAAVYLADEAAEGSDVLPLPTEFHLLADGTVLELDFGDGFGADRTGCRTLRPGGPVDWEALVCKLAVQGQTALGSLVYLCTEVLEPF